jgi:hypothetical protein
MARVADEMYVFCEMELVMPTKEEVGVRKKNWNSIRHA